MQQEIEDIELKLRSAGQAVRRARATDKDKAGLKLIEQEHLALQQKERRQSNVRKVPPQHLDGKKALDKKAGRGVEGHLPRQRSRLLCGGRAR
ncbi:MAG TPA: hypothetical protein VD994_07795 [Prosthecobacter sp.]|nr:hypothetical protein [Prosthecobacter sp.]